MPPLTNQRVIWALVLFAAAVTGFRLWYSSVVGLAPDEAYYWTWSRQLSFSYNDHPPLIAWLIRLGTWILGDNATGVRLTTILTGGVAIPLVYLFARSCGMDKRAGLIAAMLSTCLPSVCAGAFIATPDSPLALAWLLGCIGMLMVATRGNPRGWYLWGFATGLGLLSKHSAGLLVVIAIMTLLVNREARSNLKTLHPWAASAIALTIALPHLLSEIQAGFPSVTHQLAHLAGDLPGGGAGVGDSLPARIGGLLSGQLGLMTPLVAIFAVAASISSFRTRTHLRVPALFALVPVLAALLVSFFVHPEQNWASLGHPVAAVLAVVFLAKWSRKWLWATVGLVLVATIIVHLHTASPFLPLDPKRDPVSRLHGWDALPFALGNLSGYDAVVCDNYGLAAELEFALADSDSTVTIGSTDRPSRELPVGTWLILDQQGDWGAATPAVNCDSVEELDPISMTRADGQVVRVIRVALGTGCDAVPGT